MFKNYLFIIQLILISVPTFSQVNHEILILDYSTKEKIPFATISNNQKTIGSYANENGLCNLDYRLLTNDTTIIIVHALGYEELYIMTKDVLFKDTITLINSGLFLEEIVVNYIPINEKNNDNYLGINAKKSDGNVCSCNLNKQTSFEIALRIDKNEIQKSIESIYFFLDKKGVTNTPFRIKIYSEKNKTPYNLLHSQIIKPKKNLKKWNKFIITEPDITKESDCFFISMEWLKTNEEEYIYINNNRKCFGQSLGLSANNNQSEYFVKSANGKWYDGKIIFKGFYPMIKVKMK